MFLVFVVVVVNINGQRAVVRSVDGWMLLSVSFAQFSGSPPLPNSKSAIVGGINASLEAAFAYPYFTHEHTRQTKKKGLNRSGIRLARRPSSPGYWRCAGRMSAGHAHVYSCLHHPSLIKRCHHPELSDVAKLTGPEPLDRTPCRVAVSLLSGPWPCARHHHQLL